MPRSPSTLPSPAATSSARGSTGDTVNRDQPLRHRAGEEQRMDLGITRVTSTLSMESYICLSTHSHFSSYQRSSVILYKNLINTSPFLIHSKHYTSPTQYTPSSYILASTYPSNIIPTNNFELYSLCNSLSF